MRVKGIGNNSSEQHSGVNTAFLPVQHKLTMPSKSSADFPKEVHVKVIVEAQSCHLYLVLLISERFDSRC